MKNVYLILSHCFYVSWDGGLSVYVFLYVLFLLKILIKNNGLINYIFLRIIIDKLNNDYPKFT